MGLPLPGPLKAIFGLGGTPPPINGAFILNLDTFDFAMLTYLAPELQERKNAVYYPADIAGRSEPIMGYSHSGPRIFQVPVHLVAESSPFLEVVLPIRIMRSWVYPDYTFRSQPSVPPRLLFVMGVWLMQRCICLDVDVRYMAPWSRIALSDTIAFDTLLPHNAIVTLTLQEVMENSRTAPFDTLQVKAGLDLWTLDALINLFL